ncbi:hypothetical protein Rsub_12507 [Raphidocelis subcapitata]|uniref:Elongator complex protein 1 n=1 Tax=Raphidocelis subcapitata TaxID=307507 RepID=A0A2V0PQS5_9CHLO|nr:hypothetical protein Rsub_12507 [Raphidocelis subcapitata]|eukprot:GBF99867.1 hypothetical protein Rsub_12507 [Raphidocelis subcapitata]
MRNLIAALESHLIQLGDGDSQERVTAFCHGAGDGRVYCATDAAAVVCVSERDWTVEWRAPLAPPAPGAPPPCVVALSHQIESEALFAALSSGELLLLNPATREVEEAGAIAGGVAAAAWAPDGEAVAHWDVLAEVTIPREEAAAPPQAAAAAAAGGGGGGPNEAPAAEAWGEEGGCGTVSIAWRGDGRYFATCSGGAGRARRVHIWDREGCQLHATGEGGPDLTGAISWQPNGRHLYAAARATPPEAAAAREAIAGAFAAAAAARLRDAGAGLVGGGGGGGGGGNGGGGGGAGCDGAPLIDRVVLLERNGLRHGSFDLPPALGGGGGGGGSCAGGVRDLIWSPDSELLAVVLGPAGGWRVQVWHRSNWHWYLKQELPFPHLPPSGSLSAAWDEERPGLLTAVSSDGECARAALRWGACVSARGTAAVVDGCDVLLTPFSRSNAPPPLCAARARFPRPVAALAFLDDDGAGCEALAVITSDGRLGLARAVEADCWEETVEEQQLWLRQSKAAARAAAGAAAPDADAGKAQPAAGEGKAQPAAGARALPAQSHLALRQRVAGAWDEAHVLLPLGSLAPRNGAANGPGGGGGGDPNPPLAGGRRIKAAAWLGPGRLLLVAAPHPEPGLEASPGDVLVELTVRLPEPLLSAPEGEAPPEAEPLEWEEAAVSYAGGSVLSAAPLPPPALAGAAAAVGAAAPGAAAGAAGAAAALLQLASGALLRYEPGGGGAVPLGAAASFPAPCSAFAPLPLPPALPGAGGGAAVGLTPGGVLYCGPRAVAGGVTSFAVRWGGAGGAALLYTTRQSLLFTVMLRQLQSYVHKEPDVSSLPAPPSQRDPLKAAMSAAMRPAAPAAAARDVHVRAVEQGARLVAAPAGGAAAVLQLPRGNLETVAPRLLVLSSALGALAARDYRAAWGVAVAQRLDPNLLVDFRWPAFLGEAAAFVEAIADPADICDLLFALKPGSVLSPGGLYAGLERATGLDGGSPGAQNGSPGPAVEGGKVSAVCAAVRAAAAAADARRGGGGTGGGGRMLRVVVTSHARSDPPDLEGALLAVREAKEAAIASGAVPAVSGQPPAVGDAGSDDEDDDAIGDGDSGAPVVSTAVNGPAGGGAAGAGGGAAGGAAEAALRHLLLHVDADSLYRAALGLYDLPLAFMVVSHAQKDPGEYLEELSRLGAVKDEHLRRHAIDLHLRRYDRALSHLVLAGPAHFDAALELARRHGLLRQLVGLLRAEVAQSGPGQSGAAQSGLQPRQGQPQQQQQGQQQQGQQGPADGRPPADAAAEPPRARLARALAAHADALSSARKHEDAAVARLAAGDADGAVADYAAGGHWRMALALAARRGWGEARTAALARDLASSLATGGGAAEAAVVLREYLRDADGAVAALAAAREWREALRVCYAEGRADLVDTAVVPAAAEAAAGLLAEAREARDKVDRYSSRLKEVRARRLAMRAALDAADADADAALDGLRAGLDDDDRASEAPSVISGFSIYTDATAAGGPGASTLGGGSSAAASAAAPSTLGGRRAARKQKKQRGSRKVKAGSPEEEAALREHLAGLGPPRHALEEAGQLTELLCVLGHAEDAQKLQSAVAAWQSGHAEAVREMAEAEAAEAAEEEGAAAAAAGQQQQWQRQRRQQQQPSPAAAAAEVAWKWDVLRDA